MKNNIHVAHALNHLLSSDDLKNHDLFYLSEKLYTCPVYNKKYTKSVNLSCHL